MNNDTAVARPRLPFWLKRRLRTTGQADEVNRLLDDLKLHTVCQGAHCPNQCECFGRGTATFLILGHQCTRACRFCAIEEVPAPPDQPDADEPARVAEACKRMDLKHVVITSITRDDLPDGGAGHFTDTIRAVRKKLPQATIEVLTPDFRGNRESLDTVIDARPDVFNHNIETVERLYEQVRPQADYTQSLDVLSYVRRKSDELGLDTWTKSGIMLGLGETPAEVRRTLADLVEAGCEAVTIGQYLAPSSQHHPVQRFIPPTEFWAWNANARSLGFRHIAAGPFVRSSYEAEQLMRMKRRK